MNRLEDICETIVDCEHKTAPTVPEGYPLVRTTDIKNGRIILEGANRVSEEVYGAWTRRRQPRPGDLILAREAPVGEVGLVPEGVRPVLGQRTVLISPDRSKVSTRYLHYLLLSPFMRHELEVRSAGSTVPHLNMADIRNLELPELPALPTQNRVGETLGALDDKIENNRKTAATLEEMARALYRSWFVDFDPIHAKAAGEKPAHMDEATAALFPDRFGGDGLPEGWSLGQVQDLCKSVSSGGTPSRKEIRFWESGEIPWFKTGELHDGPLIDSDQRITQAAIEGSSAKIWPAGTILFALYASPTVGRLGVLTKPGASNQAAAGLMAMDLVGTPFLRRALIEARAELQNLAVGAAQQNINQGTLKSHRVILPPKSLTAHYSELVSIWDTLQASLEYENRTLTQLRNILLPKLMSGEIRVDEAREQVEDVT